MEIQSATGPYGVHPMCMEEGASANAAPEAEPSLEALPDLMVELGHEERKAMRETAEAHAETARAARRAAIAQMREAADDRFSSAICQAVVGVVAAAAQVAGAAIGADAAGAAGEAANGGLAADALRLGGQALDKAGPLIDVWARAAEQHDIAAREQRDIAESYGEYAQRARADLEASRAAQRDLVDRAADAQEARDRGTLIAVGRG